MHLAYSFPQSISLRKQASFSSRFSIKLTFNSTGGQQLHVPAFVSFGTPFYFELADTELVSM
jgi:hypothetical protein